VQKVAILFGGPSSEHAVSLKSAKHVLAQIDRNKFDPREVFISKEGQFSIEGKNLESKQAVRRLKQLAEVAFPVLHGKFGEDGDLQELLEREGVAFVGSGSEASRIAIDKHASNKIFAVHGIRVPRSQLLESPSKIAIGFPVIVKPVDEGSSLGLYKFESEKEFESKQEEIFGKYSRVLAQEFINGREFTCGVIEVEGKETALPASEVILKSTELFDFDAKYQSGICEEITPAQISPQLMNQIQNLAVKCHKVLGCRSISRTDMILDHNQKLYTLETNTLPGLTEASFIPAQAKAYGMNMTELITILIDSATS
jgi:D-alanine-D-alanine ligase